MITKINHIAIVTSDLDSSTGFWAEALGLTVARTENVEAESVNVAFLPVGESDIELLQPTDDESGVAKYMEKRGPGIHHLCLETDDLDGDMERLRAANVTLITERPLTNAHGTRYAFVHPKSTGGVLIELYETTPPS